MPRSRTSAGLFNVPTDGTTRWRFCWLIRAGRFSGTRMMVFGRYPKAKLNRAKIYLSRARTEFEEEVRNSCERQLDRSRMGKAEGRQDWFTPGPSREICRMAFRFGSNNFEMEWPPGSRKMQSFPEVDQACFFPSRRGEAQIKGSANAFP